MQGNGIEYPKIEIAGTEYTVKFTRAALYRLDKAGFDLRTLATEIGRWLPKDTPSGRQDGYVRLSVLFDVLHAAIMDQLPPGTLPADLVAMALPDSMPLEEVSKRTAQIGVAIILAIGKMPLPAQTRLQETGAPITELRQ